LTAYRQATVDVHGEKIRQSHDHERRTTIGGCPVSVLGDESFTELVVKSFSVRFHEEVVQCIDALSKRQYDEKDLKIIETSSFVPIGRLSQNPK
jgi:hypothetical protein